MTVKRKRAEAAHSTENVTPKKRRTAVQPNGHFDAELAEYENVETITPVKHSSSKKNLGNTPSRTELIDIAATALENGIEQLEEEGSPTPKPNGTTLFSTPRKKKSKLNETTASGGKADRSAKRKSAKALLERGDEDDWEGELSLARDILEDEDKEPAEGGDDLLDDDETKADGAGQDLQPAAAETPSRRGRGRPKGSKNKRSPTPEGDIPPEERYFFQNRPGPLQISNNTLASIKLPTHEEYFEQMRKYRDRHEPEKKYLTKLHARSFQQWRFELSEGFNICLYGWGSKRLLVNKFAEWLSTKADPVPQIIIVNGYTPKINIRGILHTIASTVTEGEASLRMIGSPQDLLDTILGYLDTHPRSSPLTVMVNSIDAPGLRRRTTQSVLARLASHSNINLIATADTPSLGLLWGSTLKKQFNFVFHDCTTYAPFDAEFSVVDEVLELLGRKGRRIGGKEGIGFVLKSLPENARNLYRVLLTELVAILSDGMDGMGQDDLDEEDSGAARRTAKENAGEVGVEYRSLYQKASEEFICSSDMNFRFLLKEFHDHQMITSTRDASGTEMLGVPLGREEMEAVLEDLVLG